MSDNLDMTPQLTLTPEADTAAAAAPPTAPPFVNGSVLQKRGTLRVRAFPIFSTQKI